jgi:hypothetical protein
VFDLEGPVRAGNYHFVLDAIVIAKVDVEFKLISRGDSHNTVLASWSQHFDPLATGFTAQAYEVDQAAPAIDFEPGDQLVFQYSATNTTKVEAWIPNGDGSKAKGRIPSLSLPTGE